MENKKPFVLILEGSQSVGKSSIAKAIREKVGSTTLLDLSGCPDKTMGGKNKTFNYHKSILKMIKDTHECQMNYVISRSFMSETVYTNLGYKPYNFKDQDISLIIKLDDLRFWYRVYFIVLTSTEEEFKERLQRDKFEYNPFSVENSMTQQEQYKKELRRLERLTEGVKCIEIPNRNIDDTVEVIMNSILTDMIG